MTLRLVLKRSVQCVAIVLAFPAALFCLFGRIQWIYTMSAHQFSSFPGLPGNFLRAAFYWWTLQSTSLDTTISFGTFFVHPEASVAEGVSIGSYCVIGRARIGARTQIASHVEITSGRHQHERDVEGNLVGSSKSEVKIGTGCWIGASAIILADVGDGSTIGAGAVVLKPVPSNVIAVGNPARVLER